MNPAGIATLCTPGSGAVVALKPLADAKSRLSEPPRPLPPDVRRRLAWAMAVDTLRALQNATEYLVVVGDQPRLAEDLAAERITALVLPEPPSRGMNEALAAGAGELFHRGCRTVLACVADLPALRPESVRAVLTASTEDPRAFLADALGTGTTMLVARDVPLDPRFQGHSAAAHRASGAVSLVEVLPPGWALDARQDVDTEADLAAAYRLGLGPATAAMFAAGGIIAPPQP